MCITPDRPGQPASAVRFFRSFPAAISAFISRISSANFASHSASVFAYTFRAMRLPLIFWE